MMITDEIQEHLQEIKRIVSSSRKFVNLELIIKMDDEQYHHITKKITNQMMQKSLVIPAQQPEMPETTFVKIRTPYGDEIKFENNEA